ncbi:T9SS type A sorting domain-containing protein [Phaeodactylibacter xiamenensis]|uniref:T9SS type A sorting domain-containing protein n=1 Tax=Phaeodactylibacter xiamenensis TaxID=1524460 RepID=UPI0024A7C63F|nr:T9SS type A sorting domain-containing protein [Phaeodactylibacter xiamenensis]
MKQKTENIPGTFSKGILAFGFWVIAFMLSAPCPSSAQQMEIGTNFWARVDWTGELPFKNGVNFSSAWNSGIGDDHLVNENVWNEAFLEEIEFYTVLRFMDWVPTNKSPIQFWHQRRLPTDQGQTATFNEDLGIAYEWMVDLCNRTDADMWICLPHKAVDDYHINLAELIHGQLKPGLKVYVEYSNEVWNFQEQGGYADQQGAALGLTRQQYVAHRSAELWGNFQTVFGEEFENRVVKTICGQATNSWIGHEQLTYLYSSDNPNGLHPDVFGIAPYFGGNGLNANVSNVWQLLHTDIFDHRWDNPSKDSRMDGVIKNYEKVKAIDESINLIAYEGGQHIQTNADMVNYDPEMYGLYIEYLEALDDYLTVFAHYVNAGECSSQNCWGSKRFTGQPMADAPKYRALYDYAQSSTGFLDFKREIPGIRAFPNPCREELALDVPAAETGGLVVYNPFGQQVLTTAVNSLTDPLTLDTGALPPGLYYVQLRMQDGTLRRSSFVKGSL